MAQFQHRVPPYCVAGVCSKEDADIVGISLNDTLPTYIHTLMFAPNVEALCTEQQRQYWLPRCESMEVCNCVGYGAKVDQAPFQERHSK